MNLYTGELARAEGCVTYGIRPEHLTLVAQGGKWQGTVRFVERLGPDAMVHLHVAGLGDMTVRTSGEIALSTGDETGIMPQEGREHRFAD